MTLGQDCIRAARVRLIPGKAGREVARGRARQSAARWERSRRSAPKREQAREEAKTRPPEPTQNPAGRPAKSAPDRASRARRRTDTPTDLFLRHQEPTPEGSGRRSAPGRSKRASTPTYRTHGRRPRRRQAIAARQTRLPAIPSTPIFFAGTSSLAYKSVVNARFKRFFRREKSSSESWGRSAGLLNRGGPPHSGSVG